MAGEQNHSFFLDQSWHFTTQLFPGHILCLCGPVRHTCLAARAARKPGLFLFVFKLDTLLSQIKFCEGISERQLAILHAYQIRIPRGRAWKCVIGQAPWVGWFILKLRAVVLSWLCCMLPTDLPSHCAPRSRPAVPRAPSHSPSLTPTLLSVSYHLLLKRWCKETRNYRTEVAHVLLSFNA